MQAVVLAALADGCYYEQHAIAAYVQRHAPPEYITRRFRGAWGAQRRYNTRRFGYPSRAVLPPLTHQLWAGAKIIVGTVLTDLQRRGYTTRQPGTRQWRLRQQPTTGTRNKRTALQGG